MKRENHFNHPHHRINHDRQEIADAIAKAQTTTALLPEQPSPIPHKDTFCADIYAEQEAEDTQIHKVENKQ